MKTFKFTAFAAAAIIGAVMFTGCGDIVYQNSTPGQPATQSSQQASGQQGQTQNVQQGQSGSGNTGTWQAPDFTGSYHEEHAGRGMMTISGYGDGSYCVSISWASNAAEKSTWTFTGSFDNSGILYYYDCNMTNEAFDENGNYVCDSNGNQTPYTVYSTGTGTLEFDGFGFIWNDNMGDVAQGTRFVAD